MNICLLFVLLMIYLIALFVKGRQEPVYQTTKMAVYRQSQEVLRTLDYKSPDDFAVVNSKLAQSLLDEYKSI